MVTRVKTEEGVEGGGGGGGSDLAKLGDVEYLLARCAGARRQGDASAARAWLATARMVFPRDARVQMEAYRDQSQGRRARQAARTLGVMLESMDSASSSTSAPSGGDKLLRHEVAR